MSSLNVQIQHSSRIQEREVITRPLMLNTFIYLFLFWILHRIQHCTGHIMTGSSGFCTVNLPTNGKQLPAFPLEAVPGTRTPASEVEARVLPLCHRGPLMLNTGKINNSVPLYGKRNSALTTMLWYSTLICYTF